MANIQKTNSELSKFVEFLHNDGEIKPFLKDIYLITVHVAGLDFVEDIEEIFPNIKKGDTLELFREKSNVHDELAILVKFDGEKIGYVPKKDNEVLANLMDAGKELYGVVENVFKDEVYEGYPFKVVEFKIFLKE